MQHLETEVEEEDVTVAYQKVNMMTAIVETITLNPKGKEDQEVEVSVEM